MNDIPMSYRSVNIPEPLIQEIEKLLKKQYQGYRTKAEFITSAVREKLDKINNRDDRDADYS